ncbi:MAG: hypothetical protein O3C28_16860 [Proteobacteria bacterium]|nr:hypothetical protein [Pseudomonadota bacterium]
MNSFWTKTLLIGLFVSLTACSSAPEKPSIVPAPAPEPQSPPPEPRAETQPRDSGQQPSDSVDSQTPADQQASQTLPAAPSEAPAQDATPAASAATADVEIRDIPVDENGDPIVQPIAETDVSRNSTSTDQSSNDSRSDPSSEPRSGDSGASNEPSDQVSVEAVGPGVNFGAETDQERAAKLKQNLDTKLAEFDELMRRAREDAARDAAALRGGPAGGDGREPGATENGRGADGQSDSASGIGNNPDLVGLNRGGNATRPSGPIPSDIPSAPDDDIVARQLREAATRESDPVLRERLWEEYRKYSKGIKH